MPHMFFLLGALLPQMTSLNRMAAPDSKEMPPPSTLAVLEAMVFEKK